MRNSSGAETVAVGTLRAPATTGKRGVSGRSSRYPLTFASTPWRAPQRATREALKQAETGSEVREPYVPVTWVRSNSHAAKASPLLVHSGPSRR